MDLETKISKQMEEMQRLYKELYDVEKDPEIRGAVYADISDIKNKIRRLKHEWAQARRQESRRFFV